MTALNETSKEKLEELRKKEEEDLVTILSKKYGLKYINLQTAEISTKALRIVSEKDAHDAEVAAFQMQGNTIALALRTPNSAVTQKAIRNIEEMGYKVIPHMVSLASLEHAWSHYKDLSLAVESSYGVLNISNEEVQNLQGKLTTVERVRGAIKGALEMERQYRTSRVLEVIIAGALSNDASDVHFEPRDEDVMIRFRLDGVLVEITTLDKETYDSALTRIKLLSGLKINIKNAPQDGRFSLIIGEKEIELRTSVLPEGNGETIVLRLLDPYSIGLPLEELGIKPELLEKLMVEIRKPNGMILNTGPTGSGKTTTLYAFLKRVVTPGIKILTIEDPIEYHLDGIVQTQVDHKNYTFASGLRSALRQDPDIIMVGEIRDEEVASTAIHAALTGHLVFSTLHTNNAAGAFPRLIDMNIQPSMAGSAVNAVMAQRLVRRLVPEKSKKIPLEGKDREFVEKILNLVHDKSLIPQNIDYVWIPEEETNFCYKGRVGVYETVFSTRDIEQAIRDNLTTRELEDEARKQQGFLSMREDAVLKALNGVTSLDEVRRVLGETIYDD